jgi:hypothetical protein
MQTYPSSIELIVKRNRTQPGRTIFERRIYDRTNQTQDCLEKSECCLHLLTDAKHENYDGQRGCRNEPNQAFQRKHEFVATLSSAQLLRLLCRLY